MDETRLLDKIKEANFSIKGIPRINSSGIYTKKNPTVMGYVTVNKNNEKLWTGYILILKPSLVGEIADIKLSGFAFESEVKDALLREARKRYSDEAFKKVKSLILGTKEVTKVYAIPELDKKQCAGLPEFGISGRNKNIFHMDGVRAIARRGTEFIITYTDRSGNTSWLMLDNAWQAINAHECSEVEWDKAVAKFERMKGITIK